MVEVMTSESIALLANIIYEREVAEKNPSVFTFFQLRLSGLRLTRDPHSL